MDAALLVKALAAFAFVLGLMFLLQWGIKRIGLATVTGPRADRRLSIVEFMNVDARRRLVLVRCDDREHLLLLGSNSETVVAGNLTPPAVPAPAPLTETEKTAHVA